MPETISSAVLLLALLNPFLVSIYLFDVVEKLPRGQFLQVLARAGAIAGAVFCCFALLGDAIFSSVIQAEFASFQIFGGIVFLLVGIQFIFRGTMAIEVLRGDSEHLAGAIAMPVLIGPGTISASVVIGKRHDPILACLVVVSAVFVSVVLMQILKMMHDYVRPRNSRLIQRYTEITGRIAALYAGTVSVDMIMQGIQAWAAKF